MTSEEAKAIVDKKRSEKELEKKRWHWFYYEQKLDYSECEKPKALWENVHTLNQEMERKFHPYGELDKLFDSSLYYIPDEIYSEERNADPCPYPPSDCEEWNLKIDRWTNRYYEHSDIKELIVIAKRFMSNRVDYYLFWVKLILFLGLVGLMGCILYEPEDTFIMTLVWIAFVITFMFTVRLEYFAPFSKRKRALIRLWRFYYDWENREKKRRKRLAFRNAKMYGIKKPTFWNVMIAHSSYFRDGKNTYYDF